MYFLCFVLKCFSLYNLAAPQTFYCLLLSYKPKILYAITVVQGVPRRSGCVEGTFRSWKAGEHQHSKYKKFLRTGLKGEGQQRRSSVLAAEPWAHLGPLSFSAVGAEPWLLVVWATGGIICDYAGWKCHAVPEGRAAPPVEGCRHPQRTSRVTNGATSGDLDNVAGAKCWGTNCPCQRFAAVGPGAQCRAEAWCCLGWICPRVQPGRVLRESPGLCSFADPSQGVPTAGDAILGPSSASLRYRPSLPAGLGCIPSVHVALLRRPNLKHHAGWWRASALGFAWHDRELPLFTLCYEEILWECRRFSVVGLHPAYS